MRGQNNEDRQSQCRQIPQFERHQRNRQKQRQTDVPQYRDFALKHLIQAKCRKSVAQDHTHEQDTNERRQLKCGFAEHAIEEIARQQTHGDQCECLDKRKWRDRAFFIRLLKTLWHPWLFLLNAARYLCTLDQQASDRPSNQTAQHQSKRRRGHCKLSGGSHTVFLTEGRAPRSTCAMTTCQRHRACQQAHQRIEAQRRREPDTHGILDHQQPGHRQQENPHYAPAFFQAGEVCTQANGGEKRQHQWSL
ncbi:hypothetical protein D3C84_676870 [compost metagenome]